MKSIINQDKYSANIFWKLCNYLILIDTINGFFLLKGTPLPIGQAYKFVLMLFLAYQLAKIRRGQILVTLTICYFLIYINHVNLSNNSNFLSECIILFSKFIIVPWIYVYLMQVKNECSPLTFWNNCIKCFKINIFFLCINIFSGLFGIGGHTYDNKIGYKGFLYAVNEVSGFAAVLFSLFLYHIHINHQNSKKVYYLYSILFLITALLFGTKTMLIIVLVSVYYIPYITNHSAKKKKNKCTKLIIFILSIVLVIYGGIFIINEMGFLDRWIYFYQQGGIERIIFSGRDEFWLNAKKEFFSSTLYTQFLGLGKNQTVEMDQFDILLNFGYVGILIIYSFYFKLIIQAYRCKNKYNISKLIFFVDTLLLGVSCIAGHILFSGLLGPFLGIINSLFNTPNYVARRKLSS